ncbi:hypothetical protein ACN47E_009335 [Coniothyrium glycines]
MTLNHWKQNVNSIVFPLRNPMNTLHPSRPSQHAYGTPPIHPPNTSPEPPKNRQKDYHFPPSRLQRRIPYLVRTSKPRSSPSTINQKKESPDPPSIENDTNIPSGKPIGLWVGILATGTFPPSQPNLGICILHTPPPPPKSPSSHPALYRDRDEYRWPGTWKVR